MNFPILLAHGSLGAWDEVIFLSVGAIFLALMGLSWVKSRASTPKPELRPPAAAPDGDADHHFRLE